MGTAGAAAAEKKSQEKDWTQGQAEETVHLRR